MEDVGENKIKEEQDYVDDETLKPSLLGFLEHKKAKDKHVKTFFFGLASVVNTLSSFKSIQTNVLLQKP